MWYTLLASVLSSLPGALGNYWQKKVELQNANLEYQKQLLQAQIIMAQETARAQLDYQTAALNATTPVFKQRIFWFLSIPILLSVILPSKAAVMWANLALIPDSYWTLYSAIVLTIWGIPVASNMVGKVFTGLTSYAADRRADKIQMLSVSSEQYKKAFADMYRAKNGSISQKQWESLEKTLDALGTPPQKAE